MLGAQWTPRQISEDMTIPQIVALWMKDEAEGWRTVSSAEAMAILRRNAEKARKERVDAEAGRVVCRD